MDSTPQTTTISTSLHDATPLELLKQVGLILQQGYTGWSSRGVSFDPTSQQWRTADGAAVPDTLVWGRRETLPAGVVVVVGDYANRDAQTLARHLDGFRRSLEWRRDMGEDVDSLQLQEDDLINMGSVSADAAFLTPTELAHTITQYITRSVPTAVQRTDAVIVSLAKGELQETLEQGLTIYKRYGGVKALSTGIGSAPPHSAFTHHINLISGTEEDRLTLTLRLVLALHERKVGRRSIPVVVVVAGGTSIDVLPIVRCCVAHRWKVVAIEGTGGVADDLCALLHRQQKTGVVPSSVDAAVYDGVTATIGTAVSRGCVVEVTTQSLVALLAGDDTLVMSWWRYASWSWEAERARKVYFYLLNAVIATGILAIVASLVSVMLSTDTNERTAGRVILDVVVITIPIVMHLLQAINNRINAGGRWAALRYASVQILQEIYSYRMQVGEYRPTIFVSDLPNMGHTRQERLHRVSEEIAEVLSSQVGATAVKRLDGEAVPPSVLAVGDDGLSDLEAHQYLRLRVLPTINAFLRDVNKASRRHNVHTVLIHIFITAGILIGSIATLDELEGTNTHIWIAFSSAVAGALARLDSTMMCEWQLIYGNYTISRLRTVLSWWTSRGPLSVKRETISSLVQRVEAVVDDEAAEFLRQLKASVAVSRKTAAFMDNLRERVEESIPGGNDSEAEESLSELQSASEGEAQPEPAERKEEADPPLRRAGVYVNIERASTLIDVDLIAPSGELSLPLSYTESDWLLFVPSSVMPVIVDESVRTAFLHVLSTSASSENWATLSSLSRSISASHTTVEGGLKRIPLRFLLEIARLALRQEACVEMVDTLSSAGLTVEDVVVPGCAFHTTVQQLHTLAMCPWRRLTAEGLLQMLPLPLRVHVGGMAAHRLRSLLKRVEAFFVDPSPAVLMERALVALAAHADLRAALAPTAGAWLALRDLRAVVRAPFALDFVPPAMVREKFPPTMRAYANSVDVLTLVAIMKEVRSGTIAMRAAHAAMELVGPTHAPFVHAMCGAQPSVADCVAALMEVTSVEEMLRLRHEAILQGLHAVQLPWDVRDVILRTPTSGMFKLFVSAFALCGATLSSMVQDRLRITLTTVNVDSVLPLELVEDLVRRVAFMPASSQKSSVDLILRSCAIKPLCGALQKLHEGQLKEIVMRTQRVCVSPFAVHTLTVALLELQDDARLHRLSRLNAIEVEEILVGMSFVSPDHAMPNDHRIFDETRSPCRLVQRLLPGVTLRWVTATGAEYHDAGIMSIVSMATTSLSGEAAAMIGRLRRNERHHLIESVLALCSHHSANSGNGEFDEGILWRWIAQISEIEIDHVPLELLWEPLPAVQQSLHHMLLSSMRAEYRSFLATLVSLCCSVSPMYIFDQLCHQRTREAMCNCDPTIASIDLKRLLTSPRARCALIATAFEASREEECISSSNPILNRIDFTRALSELSLMHENVVDIMQQTALLIRSNPLGRMYRFMRLLEQASGRERPHLREATFLLWCVMDVRASEVRQELGGLDVRVFGSSSTTRRRSAFLKLLQDDLLADALAQYSANELLPLFATLKRHPEAESSDMVESINAKCEWAFRPNAVQNLLEDRRRLRLLRGLDFW